MDRNFLRAEVLPLLASRWPAYRRSVARAAAHLAATAVALADALGVPETIYSALGDPGLALAPLVTGPEEVAATRLRVWLRAAGQRAPDSLALTEFLRQLRVAAVDGGPRLVSGSFRLQRYREGVYLLPEWGQPPPADAVELAPGMCVEVPGVGAVSVRPASGAGLRLAPGEILTLHWRSGGEQCHLLGRRGSRSLKAVMQECAVPPWWRDRVPLVSLQGELLAAGDLARCESRRWQTAPQESETLWNLCWERPAFAGSD
jgi:tRNA(Ile)-lysidine synthase